MAKKPTTTPTPAPTGKASAPAQPWAAPGQNAGIPKPAAPVAGDAPAPAADTQNPPATGDSLPSEAHDQMTPSGQPDAAHEQAREEAGGNGGGTPGDVPSELIDQHTPSGPSPETVDKQAEALTPESSPNRTDAEAKDQVTPVGEDLSSAIHQQLSDLDDDERAEFEAFMTEQAKAKLAQLTRGREARAMEVNIIDGNAHYGNKIPRRRAKQVEV